MLWFFKARINSPVEANRRMIMPPVNSSTVTSLTTKASLGLSQSG